MFDLAVKYEVHNLKAVAMEKFDASLDSFGQEFSESFLIECIEWIFTRIPKGDGKPLRDAFLASAKGYRFVTRIIATPGFSDLCEKHGEIGHAFLTADFRSKFLKLSEDEQGCPEMIDLLNSLNSTYKSCQW